MALQRQKRNQEARDQASQQSPRRWDESVLGVVWRSPFYPWIRVSSVYTQLWADVCSPTSLPWVDIRHSSRKSSSFTEAIFVWTFKSKLPKQTIFCSKIIVKYGEKNIFFPAELSSFSLLHHEWMNGWILIFLEFGWKSLLYCCFPCWPLEDYLPMLSLSPNCLFLVRYSPHHQHQEKEGGRHVCLKTLRFVIFTAGNPAPPLCSVRGKQTKERDRTRRSSGIGMRRPRTRRWAFTTPSLISGGHSYSWGPRGKFFWDTLYIITNKLCLQQDLLLR